MELFMELFNTAHKVRPYAAIPQVKGQERGVAISHHFNVKAFVYLSYPKQYVKISTVLCSSLCKSLALSS